MVMCFIAYPRQKVNLYPVVVVVVIVEVVVVVVAAAAAAAAAVVVVTNYQPAIIYERQNRQPCDNHCGIYIFSIAEKNSKDSSCMKSCCLHL